MAGNLIITINNYAKRDLSIFSKIEYLDYDADSTISTERMANNLKECYDEVYVLQLDSYNEDFIAAIRKTGKRIK